jgi:hypothetical protein
VVAELALRSLLWMMAAGSVVVSFSRFVDVGAASPSGPACVRGSVADED